MSRKTPRSKLEIKQGIRMVKSFARKDLSAIHLIECDFEKVRRKPKDYEVTEQEDGSLVTVFHGRLIDILSS